MESTTTSELRAAVREYFAPGDEPVRQRLLSLIRVLDTAQANLFARPDAEAELLVRRALAVAAVATAPVLTAHLGNAAGVLETAAAAKAFLASPSEPHWTAFESAATNSYPFGPGDGCLAVDELGGHGAPGAGDGGAGFIWQVVLVAGAEPVYEVLDRELPKALR